MAQQYGSQGQAISRVHHQRNYKRHTVNPSIPAGVSFIITQGSSGIQLDFAKHYERHQETAKSMNPEV